jgi:hypothetical protein
LISGYAGAEIRFSFSLIDLISWVQAGWEIVGYLPVFRQLLAALVQTTRAMTLV